MSDDLTRSQELQVENDQAIEDSNWKELRDVAKDIMQLCNTAIQCPLCGSSRSNHKSDTLCGRLESILNVIPS